MQGKQYLWKPSNCCNMKWVLIKFGYIIFNAFLITDIRIFNRENIYWNCKIVIITFFLWVYNFTDPICHFLFTAGCLFILFIPVVILLSFIGVQSISWFRPSASARSYHFSVCEYTSLTLLVYTLSNRQNDVLIQLPLIWSTVVCIRLDFS